ncbi:LbH_MAT_like domain containing protein [uncultured Caudovirales phage]|uniref:LbH_MAT_like domain containing protein n=1 Tax=uncultured Caudovirales phage TaxID=2100421 RepID=A0A6J5NSF6_9CAUD|nr:LbH_MAT_like domain containing protein [uncultured Caudovirales phage]
MMQYVDLDNNVHITAKQLNIGNNVRFGKDVKINVRGTFEIGDNSIIGDRFTANAEELIIGEYFYNGPTDSRGMVIGGGGANFPYAKLKIGDRVVCHTGHINLASPVTIGNDVGLSHDVDLITHGFWYSVLEGYPRVFKEINIGNNVIIGWKTVIMSGVTIADNTVIGSHSTVTKSLLDSKAIYAGSPAKLIKHITEPTLQEKQQMLESLIVDFKDLMTYYDVPEFTINAQYPYLLINQLSINVNDFSYTGEHDAITDAFRDFARRYGIRIYVPHGFKFNLTRK